MTLPVFVSPNPDGEEGLSPTVSSSVLRWSKSQGPRTIQDTLMTERRMDLVVDGVPEVTVVFTPGMEREWALGYLLSSRRIGGLADVASLELRPGQILVALRRALPGVGPRGRLLHSGSSALHSPEVSSTDFPVFPPWRTTFDIVMSGIDWIQEEELFRATGAVHVVALLRPDGTRILRVSDVGRHNAADKALGGASLRGEDLGRTMAITSGRLPDDMVFKFLGGGIPLVASVSAPTAEGVARARHNGMTLVGFCREERMNVYCGEDRLAPEE
ncbi:MAG TPA: formate dehydrogenase accessory sulfurtransferase FdhD [Synergistaceae bacterium]|nr:formate dehydrogenase accessory sulfurtransferase FdhD [Synergistaceae bacterium]HQH78425.1 formate dehydrogenase accessory sulfurtransferase FdhD [Synergistaceae bacterium]HQK25893.1 formate dehydrogenase accessory sulfurtransferase FdhD [Synergistaceae bacterium]